MTPAMDAWVRLVAFVFTGTRLLWQGAWRRITTEGYDPMTGQKA